MAWFLMEWLSRFATRNRKLLLVCEDYNTQNLVKTHLSPLGRDMLTARSVDEVREILDHCSETPALCLIDAQLAGAASGVELLHLMRTRRDTFRTPAVLLHGGIGKDEESTLLAKFPRLHLVRKPLDGKELLAMVKEALRHGDRYRAARTSLTVTMPRPARVRQRQ